MLIPLILSGGAGTRLWPVSREGHPKPFLQLPDGESLLQKTLQRAARLDDISRVLVVTNRDYYFQSKDEATTLDGLLDHPPSVSYLLEPRGRNTLPAIALGALALQEQYGDEALILVLSADHLINNQEAFAHDVAIAATAARCGYLVTFGIPATSPETGFGYLEQGENLGSGAFRVGRFIEKPPLAEAQGYVTSGQHFWNAGMFCFTAGLLLQELENHQPEFLAQARSTWAISKTAAPQGVEGTHLAETEFTALANISIDYGLMEISSRVAMVPATFDWDDIGSWDALAGISPRDEQGNSHAGDVVMINSRNCHVRAEERLVAALGVENLYIVETADAILVADRQHAQQVKDVVSELKSRRHNAALLHATVVRPWGSYTVLEESLGFKIKRIEVKSGASLSLQLHQHRSEHWIVVSGQAQIVNDAKTLNLGPNESTYIPAGHRHRLRNIGDEPLVVIEVQCGPYLGEDDIVRFEDNYGRQGQ